MNQHHRIVGDENVEKALSFLRDSAAEIGSAKARCVRSGHMLRHIEALEFKASESKSAEAKKADARTTETYLKAIYEDAEACGEFERLKSLREAAAMVIEAWRTSSSNFRAMKV